jgi:hypothetical protein
MGAIMNRRQSTRIRKTRGQSLVEFALVLPVILMLFGGIIDFGWVVFNYAQLYNALREGLRYGSVPGFGATPQYYQCDAIRQHIITVASASGIQAANITVTYDTGDPAATLGPCPAGQASATVGTNTAVNISRDVKSGDRLFIDLNINVQFLSPFLKPFAPSGIPIHLRAARSLFPDGLGM